MYWMVWSMVSTRFCPGSGGRLHAAEPLAARVNRDQLLAGNAAQIVVELALQTAETFVVHADVAEHLRRQLALGIEPLGFFAEDRCHADSVRERD